MALPNEPAKIPGNRRSLRPMAVDPEFEHAWRTKLWNHFQKDEVTFDIRLATVADAALIARQRALMFQEMGLVPEPIFDSYRTRCEKRLRE